MIKNNPPTSVTQNPFAGYIVKFSLTKELHNRSINLFTTNNLHHLMHITHLNHHYKRLKPFTFNRLSRNSDTINSILN